MRRLGMGIGSPVSRLFSVGILLTLLPVGCSGRVGDTNSSRSGPAVVRLASTTSTRDSGLLDVLLPVFEREHNCRVDLIAVGTGAALKLGELGDVDAILCHARAAEDAFMRAGYGIRHEPVMHNFFLIAGPVNDPAQVKGRSASQAFARIAAERCRFVSRGDHSGTHQRELEIWQRLREEPKWDNYLQSGQGMGPTLLMADELNAYVLIDEATWLKQSANTRLAPLVTGTEDLANPYAVMVVNPQQHPKVAVELAHSLADFFGSVSVQRMIADYKVNGQPLFYPDCLHEPTVREQAE